MGICNGANAMNQWNVFIAIVFGFLIQSCETTKFLTANDVPPVFLEVFEPCFPRSGVNDLESVGIFGNGVSPVVQLAFESKNEGQVGIEVAAEIGPALLALNIASRKLEKDGIFSGIADPLSVGDDGRLLYKRYFIGLRDDEIACVIAGRLPAAWLSKITNVQKNAERQQVEIKHDGRTIQIAFDKLATPKKRSFCADISWRVAAGFFQPEVRWCHGSPGGFFSPKNNHQSMLKYDEKSIFWSPI